jgi:hypothetical protein
VRLTRGRDDADRNERCVEVLRPRPARGADFRVRSASPSRNGCRSARGVCEDAARIDADPAIRFDKAYAIAQEATDFGEIAQPIGRGDPVERRQLD